MLRAFFKPKARKPPASSSNPLMTAGKVECPYCRQPFTPQGLSSHVRWHEANNDRPMKQQKRNGKVKLRTENQDGTLTTLTKEETEALLLHEKGLPPQEEEPDTTVAKMPDETIVIDSDDEDDVVNAMEEPSGEGKTPEDDDDGADVEEVGDAPVAAKSRATRARNWHVSEKAEILVLWNGKDAEDGMKVTHTKNKFLKHVENKYTRNLQRSTFNQWLKTEDDIMASAKKTKADRRSQSIPREAAGKYPDMECILAGRIRGMRDMGMVVETWMVNAEARFILHETYPSQFPDPSQVSDDDEYPFKCSDGWRRGFFNRHNFSVKSIGKKFNVKATSEEKMRSIADFHIGTRVLQLRKIRDPVYGYTRSYYVYSHDQVPIELEDSNGTTVHDTGDDSVYDAFGKDNDTKRFCTLNLFGAMEYREDGKNVPKPHLVFHGAFKPGCDWHDKEEIEQWDPRVYVSFQENGWVDARTHQLGLENVLGPINDHLKEEDMEGVAFEDNLSSHKTEAIMQLWDNSPSLSNFIRPRFVPPNLTDIVQVIDRHIGIIYKRAVYRAFRAEYMKLYREAKAAARKPEDIKVRALTPKEKRIITTKAVADCHAKLTDPTCTRYRRAFIATATWMPVNHLFEDNDINVTACCFNVDFSSGSDDLLSIHALPCFWQFIFEKNANRKLRVVKPYDTSEYEATTLVRMAFKAFELGFPFTFDDIDPTVGTIAASQKRKFDLMKAWNDSPFHTYQCNKVLTCYKIAKKHTKENCVQCLSNSRNKKCTSKMCKQCCAAHGAPVCRAHRKK